MTVNEINTGTTVEEVHLVYCDTFLIYVTVCQRYQYMHSTINIVN